MSEPIKTIPNEKLKELGKTCVEEYNWDKASRNDWLKRASIWYQLFKAFMRMPSEQWKSNVHVPILGTAVFAYHARASDALLNQKELVKPRSTQSNMFNKASRVAKYNNFQFEIGMPNWLDDMDRALLVQAIYGTVFKKIIESPRGVVQSIVVHPFDLVAEYNCIDIKKCRRITHAYWEPIDDIKQSIQDQIYFDTTPEGERVIDKIGFGNKGSDGNPRSIVQDKIDSASGKVNAEESLKGDYRLTLEQHRYYEFKDGTVSEPVIVNVDYETSIVKAVFNRTFSDFSGNTTPLVTFVDWPFIPDPESHLGYGLGQILEGLNIGANSTFNQLSDSGSISNTQAGFYRKGFDSKSQNMRFRMGMLKEYKGMSDDIRKDIMMLPFKEPSTVLFALLGMLRDMGKEVITMESMLGKSPSSDTPATGALLAVQEGQKILGGIHKRNYRSFDREIRLVNMFNSIIVNEKIYKEVQDSESYIMQDFTSAADDFSSPVDVRPTADPNITSRAEIVAKKQATYAMVAQDPLTANNVAARWEAGRRVLEAIQEDNIDAVWPQPEEPQDLTPVQEEAKFLTERDAAVLPQQDHFAHLASHEIFPDSVMGTRLTPQGKKLLQAHVQEHYAMIHMLQEQQEKRAEMLGRLAAVAERIGNNGGIS